MSVRILNCTDNKENLRICIEERVFGFAQAIPQMGDIVYLSYKPSKKKGQKLKERNYCVARAVISQETDYKPWKDGEKYRRCYSVTNIEFCYPFILDYELAKFGGNGWGAKYLRGSIIIHEKGVIDFLNENFIRKKIDNLFQLEDISIDKINPIHGELCHYKQQKKTCQDGNKYYLYNNKASTINNQKKHTIIDQIEHIPYSVSKKQKEIPKNMDNDNNTALNKKHQKFRELAVKRVNNVISSIDKIENLSNKSSYEYTPEEVEEMFSSIEKALEKAKNSFYGKTNSRFEFSQ